MMTATRIKKATRKIKLTRTDKLAATLASAGEYTLTVRVKGEVQGHLTAAVDPDWTGPDDEETYRYVVTDDTDTVDGSDDLADVRETLAQAARDMRAERLAEIADEAEAEAEKEAEDARDLVEGLIERGRANDVVKALRAAGLI